MIDAEAHAKSQSTKVDAPATTGIGGTKRKLINEDGKSNKPTAFCFFASLTCLWALLARAITLAHS
jgi:hypothetical protein